MLEYAMQVKRVPLTPALSRWQVSVQVIEPDGEGRSFKTAKVTIERVRLSDAMRDAEDWIAEHERLNDWLREVSAT